MGRGTRLKTIEINNSCVWENWSQSARCANLFRFLLGFYGPGEQQLQMWTGLQCTEKEREREQRVRGREEGTLAACLHFRFFTPRLGFDCGLLWFKAAAGGSRQPVHVLGTWYTTRERSRERKGEEEEKSTCLAIVDSHSLLLLAAAGSLSNANCLGLLSSPNLALAVQIVWPRICRDLLMIRCGTVRVLQVEVGSGPSRGLAWSSVGMSLKCYTKLPPSPSPSSVPSLAKAGKQGLGPC